MPFPKRVTLPPEFDAMVLSAGFGTRLRPLTDEIPKPLVPLGDTPLLGRSLAALREQGARRLVVNVHHHAGRIESYLASLPMEVHVSREERILGTAGGITRARQLFGGAPLVILNGDIVGEFPIAELLSRADEGLVLAMTERPLGKGTVGLGSAGQVVRLRGEHFGTELASGDYMGVAVLGQKCLNSLPPEGCLVGDWALPHLRAGGFIHGVLVPQSFEDVGSPAAYLTANLRWLRSSAGGGATSYVGPGAGVEEGVELVSSIVGAGARVSGRGRVESSLVLPGAIARAPLFEVIVTPAGVVIPKGEGSGALS